MLCYARKSFFEITVNFSILSVQILFKNNALVPNKNCSNHKMLFLFMFMLRFDYCKAKKSKLNFCEKAFELEIFSSAFFQKTYNRSEY